VISHDTYDAHLVTKNNWFKVAGNSFMFCFVEKVHGTVCVILLIFFIVVHITNAEICSRYMTWRMTLLYIDPVWLYQSFSALCTVEPDCNI